MATAENNTFTVDTTVPTETVTENLTPEEQDSLAVGEKIAAEQDTLLAGKYKNAEELEKAYVELQKKLGDKDAGSLQEGEEATEEEVTTESEPSSLSDNASVITAASDEYYANDGKLSPETLDKFKGMSSEDLVNAYIEVTNNPEWQANAPSQVDDITDNQINEVKNAAGGEKAYNDMVTWASQNLDQKTIATFDDIVAKGNIDAIKFAVQGLKSQYQNAVGFEGTMVSGKAPQNTRDVYRSQAELVAAMSDRRYDSDPAYRQDVIQKLERSNNLEF